MSMDIGVREMLDFLDTLPPRVNQFEHLARFVGERKQKKESAAKEKPVAMKVVDTPTPRKVAPTDVKQWIQRGR